MVVEIENDRAVLWMEFFQYPVVIYMHLLSAYPSYNQGPVVFVVVHVFM